MQPGKLSMKDPTTEVQQLAQQAREFEEAAAQLPSAKQRDAGADLVGGLADLAGLSRKGRSMAKKASKSMIDARKKTRTEELQHRFDAWFGRAKHTLQAISVKKKGLAPSGNSDDLVRRLANAKDYVNVDTQARNVAKYLESLAEKPLIYNEDVTEYLRRQGEEERERQRLMREKDLFDFPDDMRGLEFVRTPNRQAVEAFFSDYPDVQEMIIGALDAYAGDGADQHRQALASCRVALEALGKTVTGEERWRDRVADVADKRVRKIFDQLYSFLSKYGAHAGPKPSDRDAQFGIRQTMVCLAWLVENEEELRPGNN